MDPSPDPSPPCRGEWVDRPPLGPKQTFVEDLIRAGPVAVGLVLDHRGAAGDEAYQRREEAFFKHRGNALLADLSRHQNRNPALRFNENNTCEVGSFLGGTRETGAWMAFLHSWFPLEAIFA